MLELRTIYAPGESTPHGDPIVVNPAMVASVVPHPLKPGIQCLVNVFGREYRVRGSVEQVCAQLGISVTDAAKPAAPAAAAEPASKGDEPKPAKK